MSFSDQLKKTTAELFATLGFCAVIIAIAVAVDRAKKWLEKVKKRRKEKKKEEAVKAKYFTIDDND